MHEYICIYTYIPVCVCVCVCEFLNKVTNVFKRAEWVAL